VKSTFIGKKSKLHQYPTACSVEKTDVLFSLTPGFSQVNWDTQLILKSVKRFLTLAAAAITWLKPGVNDS